MEVCLIIKGIDYSTGELNIILSEKDNIYYLPRNFRLSTKSSIETCEDLLYSITRLESSNWIKFFLKEFIDGTESKSDKLIYSCVIPFETKLTNNWNWIPVRKFVTELSNKTKKSFMGELKNGTFL